jgi:hypothetical protein
MSRRPAGKCIFCEAGNLSKEHFWPEWASALLPKYPINQHVERLLTFTEVTRIKEPPKSRTKSGHAWTKKIRVVCAPCNNGWMNALETAARPFLTPLISTTSHTITATAALAIAQWIALKIMVGEHNQPGDAVTLPSDRAKFRSTWQLPPNFKIWIARCGVGGWQTAYLRHAGTVSATPGVRPEHRRKNIDSITFGIGDLLVHALHTTAPDVDLGLTLSEPGVVIPLFPVVGEIMWPPARSISAEEAAFLANTLDRLFRSHPAGGFPGGVRGEGSVAETLPSA